MSNSRCFLKTKGGKSLAIRASLVPHITGKVQRPPINTNQRTKLEKEFKLPDALPVTLQISNLGLLIGNDYYQGIFQLERRKLEE